MKQPKVAIVVLNFNTSGFLKKYLPAIIDCNYQNKEIWVIDNASVDDSLEVLAKEFSNIKILVTPQNMGYAGGYAWGLPQIEADFFALVNTDVAVTPDWLVHLVYKAQENPNIAAVQPKLLDLKNIEYFEYAGASGGFIDYLGYPYCRGRIFHTIEKDQGQYNDSRPIFWASGACFLIKCEAYNKVGGLDADLFAHMEEIDLCWRLNQNGYEVWVEPKSEVYHLGGGTLETGSLFKNYLNLRNSLIVLVKNHPSKFWFLWVIVRLMLDGVYSLQSLIKGNLIILRATLKAHRYFWINFKTIYRKRQPTKILKLNSKMLFPFTIVGEYFLKGKKKYDQI